MNWRGDPSTAFSRIKNVAVEFNTSNQQSTIQRVDSKPRRARQLNPLPATCSCIDHLAILFWKFAKHLFINISLSDLNNVMYERPPTPLASNQLIPAAWAPAAWQRKSVYCKHGFEQRSAHFLHSKKVFIVFWTNKFYFYSHIHILLKFQKNFGIDRMIFSGIFSDFHFCGLCIYNWRRAPKVCRNC